ncbi:hypothetical protein SAMN02799622_06098 [Methylobacterium sp. UNC378MF]|nr:hypothetical protein SAMN02799622_06098 [Methylobacterium sp. UNC378MF]
MTFDVTMPTVKYAARLQSGAAFLTDVMPPMVCGNFKSNASICVP